MTRVESGWQIALSGAVISEVCIGVSTTIRIDCQGDELHSLSLAGPFTVTGGDDHFEVDLHSHLGITLVVSLRGRPVERISLTDDGDLELELGAGHKVKSTSALEYEAWELDLEPYGFFSLPSGEGLGIIGGDPG